MSKVTSTYGESDLRNMARYEVMKLANSNLEKGKKLKLGDVYIVWQCWILGYWKALVSTTAKDGRYYEFTFDKGKKRAYLDTYTKEDNKTISNLEKGKKLRLGDVI